jgi:hypothetical protein
VLPNAEEFYDRYYDLDRLTPEELERWKRYQVAFIRKLSLVSRGRRLLLKSPAHMARIRYLRELFPGAKFVHISRPPQRVFQSNLILWRTLQETFGLQRPPPRQHQEELTAREYLSAEEHYLADRSLIPAGDLAEVRLQDLSADPIGELKRIYRELGLPWSTVHESRLPPLLITLDERPRSRHPELTDAQRTHVARLEEIARSFGHDRPARPAAERPKVVETPPNLAAGLIRGVLAAAVCLVVWEWVEPWFGIFLGILAWPVGIAIGYAVRGGAAARSNAMGWIAALLMVTAQLVHMVPHTTDGGMILDYFTNFFAGQILTTDRIFWIPLATVIAFWIGSGRPT